MASSVGTSQTALADQPLHRLEQRHAFVGRHIGPSKPDITEMLGELGLATLNDLIDSTVPETIRLKKGLALPAGVTEATGLAYLRNLAEQNKVYKSYIGMGYYDTHTPSVIKRNVLENPGWYTAYTPYQAEIAQGRLESLLNFQQMVMDLTGMTLANASLLDEATAAAEAMTLCKRQSKSKSNSYFVADDVHPQTLDVLQTRAQYLGIEIIVGTPDTDLAALNIFGAQLQYPGSGGQVRDLSPIIDAAHAQDALVSVAADLLALVLLTPPGEMGADVVVGSAQRFGVPMGFGGPHAAFFATREEYRRNTPGRIIGVTVDARGKTALRMAMQTREQHIRREKATSNICTAQALLANMASLYAVYHGPNGLKTIANRVHRLTRILATGLEKSGFKLRFKQYFDTLTVETNEADVIYQRGLESHLNLRQVGKDALGISLDETTTAADISTLLNVFGAGSSTIEALDSTVIHAPSVLSATLTRSSDFLTHPVFNSYHSETEMMRYIKRLENKDFSLTHGMIPLGSCTMKLNAATEMAAVSWPEFAAIHPFAPAEQTQGYTALIEELKAMLLAITGYDAMSMQPNSGAQGEYAGLLAIREYHKAQGEGHRDICLIPSSAHGTNPASAVMMGMKVVVVKTDEDGNIDLDDLRAKAEKHRDTLAALMITYPSTHGVFEAGVKDACQITHDHGGQVYMDGANLNAQIGVTSPAFIGSDVSHLNLHKTFCIPHGGGGPGVGPIGVKAHLAPYLPGHRVRELEGLTNNGAVNAAPYGSALILPISWMYIKLMGAAGLLEATQVAILNANYIANRLSGHYDVLYKGQNGRVAHECIIDIRPIKEACGISEVDIAKRLMDYGFHAPTMSWPVAGTMMIEPTESESRVELDRFCDALIKIRDEIRVVERGEVSADESRVHRAPHTLDDIMDDSWDRPYSRQAAAFPSHATRTSKFWPSVNRVDDVYGDRNFVCSCPPLSSYEEDAEAELTDLS